MLTIRSTAALLLVLSAACKETVDSGDVRTSGVYPEIEVTANGSGDSTVRVELKVGGSNSNTYLELRGDDELEVTVGDTKKSMKESGNGYVATFPVDAEGTEFKIAFLRGDEDENAPESKVALPAPFELTLDQTEASRADDELKYTWDPAGDGNIGWEIDGDCIKKDEGSTPDDGSNKFGKDDIDTFESDKDKTCSVQLQLVREKTGHVDAAFEKGGHIVARHVRTKSFTSTP
ncbi:MAG TPA: hypothetical protein VFN67_15970 [Polyangiales bacterium]|nr:hypothetical protein [Polyangiales bacterium]